MSRIVIGTAGHIDHGKTALVKALTGIDTDRLKEEKARGITIELGFAPLLLPGDIQVALIDVPGHERFIKNMLAGVAGIDLALLVVAANEGVRPQTREHLAILRLLELRALIVVITKVDLVDKDILPLVREEIEELLLSTPYRQAPVLEASARTGQGIKELLELITETVVKLPERQIKEGLTRLPIDRVFTVPGAGTVVTGTLFDGSIKIGDILEIPNKNSRGKVRSLQVHGETVAEAFAGQRVAVNLTGVDTASVCRGDVLVSPGWLAASQRLDLSVQVLPDSPIELVNMVRVRFHQGTKEALGRVFVLGKERIPPGEEGYIQLVMEEPVVVARGDNYILRSYSPLHTIGGGRVIEPMAIRHKKKQVNLQRELLIKSGKDMYKLAAFLLEQSQGLVALEELAKKMALPAQEVQKILVSLVSQGAALEVKASESGVKYLSTNKLQCWEENIAREIKKHLQQFPLSPGLNKEAVRLKTNAGLTVREYNALLQLMEKRQILRLIDGQYLLPYHYEQRIPGELARKIQAIKAIYEDAAWQVPDWQTVVKKVSLNEEDAKQLLAYLLKEKTLLYLGDDLYFPAFLVTQAISRLQDWFADNSGLTVAEFRDMLGTTRRIAVPLLEYLDRMRVTKRQENQRLPGPALFDSGSFS